jgi:hypothetical protein
MPIIGNPYLRPSTSSGLMLEYRHTQKSLFYISISGNSTKNKIISNTILKRDTLNSVNQEIHYMNVNENYSIEAAYGWSKQFNEGKYQIATEGNSAFNKTPIFINDYKSQSKNISIAQSLKGSTFQDWIEITGNINYTFNNSLYNINGIDKVILQAWNLSLIGKFIFLNSWSLSINANKQFTAGLSNVSNPFILNSTLEKKILKNKINIRIQGFNIINENTGFTQSISGNTISEVHTKLNGRFFLLSLALDLKRIDTK